MSKQILVDERTGGNTLEASMAALIVGCLIHEEYIRLPKEDYSKGELVINSIRLVAALLRGKLNEDTKLPVDY